MRVACFLRRMRTSAFAVIPPAWRDRRFSDFVLMMCCASFIISAGSFVSGMSPEIVGVAAHLVRQSATKRRAGRCPIGSTRNGRSRDDNTTRARTNNARTAHSVADHGERFLPQRAHVARCNTAFRSSAHRSARPEESARSRSCACSCGRRTDGVRGLSSPASSSSSSSCSSPPGARSSSGSSEILAGAVEAGSPYAEARQAGPNRAAGARWRASARSRSSTNRNSVLTDLVTARLVLTRQRLRR